MQGSMLSTSNCGSARVPAASSFSRRSPALLPRPKPRRLWVVGGGRGRARKSSAVRVNGSLGARNAEGIQEADVIIIGSGVGGLSCGGLLARYGEEVVVFESHTLPGGAAHSFEIQGYYFDSGPSLFSGLSSRGVQANPMAQEIVNPLSGAAMAIPPAALRSDWGVVITAFARYAPSIMKSFVEASRYGGASKLIRPFSEIVDSAGIKDPFVRNWVDLLAFLLSGLKADGTLTAEVVYMFGEWYKPGCMLEYPIGGTGALVGALVRGLEKFGGRLALGSHVDEIAVEAGRAVGVRLRGGQFVRARKAVVTNASMWNTVPMLSRGVLPAELQNRAINTPQCGSFMHLHLGIDARDLPSDLEVHHIIVNDWDVGVDAPQNVVLVSIPSVLDPKLAPEGKHVLHAYTPGTEPYHLWNGLDRRSAEYQQLKQERSEVLWKAVEKALGPGFSRDKCEVKLVGTPLTHERFLRRAQGTYGPAIKAGQGSFPGHSTSIQGLFCCGDSTFPGIGIPAVTASALVTANTMVPLWEHTKLLDAIGL